jgi:hypothetical protein
MNNFDFSKMQERALPDEVKTLVVLLLEGRVKSLIIVAELQEGVGFMEGIFVDMEGGESNRYAVIGALESVKRDFMRMEVESRVDYVEPDDLIFDDDDDDDDEFLGEDE